MSAHTEYDLEAVDLLQQLIRNACVNQGTVESGHEVRSVDLLEQYLGTTGLELERFEPQPGRASLLARIEGSGPGGRATGRRRDTLLTHLARDVHAPDHSNEVAAGTTFESSRPGSLTARNIRHRAGWSCKVR